MKFPEYQEEFRRGVAYCHLCPNITLLCLLEKCQNKQTIYILVLTTEKKSLFVHLQNAWKNSENFMSGLRLELNMRNNGMNMLSWIHLGIPSNRVLVTEYWTKGYKHQTTSWTFRSQTSAFILVKGQSDKLILNNIVWTRLQLFVHDITFQKVYLVRLFIKTMLLCKVWLTFKCPRQRK